MTLFRSLVLSLLVVVVTPVAAEPASYGFPGNGRAEVQFTVDAPLDSIVGLTHAITGSMSYDPASGNATGQFSVDLSSFRTGISLRDQDLADQFFEVNRFPNAVLKIEKFKRSSTSTDSAEQVDQGVAVGTLSLHGFDRQVEIPSKIRRQIDNGRSVLSLNGLLNIHLSDFQIQRPRALFLKLGDTARVVLRAVLLEKVNIPPGVAAHSEKTEQVASLVAPLVSPPVPVARILDSSEKPKKPAFRFSEATAAGRGERLYHSPSVGGSGNAVSCSSCHSARDERLGIEINGIVPPNRTIFDSAKRPSLWQGLAKGPGKASSLCARLFMLKAEGLSSKEQSDLEAFLKAISPDDAVPALDYRVLALTRRSPLERPIQGKRKRGVLLTQRFCGGCHGVDKMRPPLTPGLYEAGYLVQRIRWLPGHDANQMPPMYVDRLSDTDLRSIVTYLAGDESKRIFNRSHHVSLRTN